MKKILVWGTGIKARRLCHYLDFDAVEIIGFTDNAENIRKELWDGYQYLSKEEALKSGYEYIVIASSFYCEIATQLLSEGVDACKIVQSDNLQFMVPNTLYFFNQVVRDEEVYKIFTDINLLACKTFG